MRKIIKDIKYIKRVTQYIYVTSREFTPEGKNRKSEDNLHSITVICFYVILILYENM